jgi:hypothetical protein
MLRAILLSGITGSRVLSGNGRRFIAEKLNGLDVVLRQHPPLVGIYRAYSCRSDIARYVISTPSSGSAQRYSYMHPLWAFISWYFGRRADLGGPC